MKVPARQPIGMIIRVNERKIKKRKKKKRAVYLYEKRGVAWRLNILFTYLNDG